MPGDLRHALRTLRRAPLVHAASVLTLALGTGLATGVLAVAYGVLLRPLPYPDPDRLAAITIHQRGDENRDVGLRLDEFERWRERLRAFDSVGGYSVAEATLRGAGDARSVRAAMITDGFFETLGVSAVEGSTASMTGGARRAALSRRLAERLAGEGDWRTSGLTIGTNGFRVGAIMPRRFAFPRDRSGGGDRRAARVGGLLMRTVERILAQPRGFEARNGLALRLRLAQNLRFEVSDRAACVRRLLADVRARPGVRAAGVGSDLPPNGTQLEMTIRIITDARDETFALSPVAVTPGYLEALGVSLVSGRLFEDRDSLASQPRIVITEETARLMFPGVDAAGREWPSALPGNPSRGVKPLVIGIVRDVRHRGLDAACPRRCTCPGRCWRRARRS